MGGGPGAHHIRRSGRGQGAVHARARRIPISGHSCPRSIRDAGLDIVDAWAEAPAGVGPGPVTEYLGSLTEVDPGDDPVVLPPLVTVLGRVPDHLDGER